MVNGNQSDNRCNWSNTWPSILLQLYKYKQPPCLLLLEHYYSTSNHPAPFPVQEEEHAHMHTRTHVSLSLSFSFSVCSELFFKKMFLTGQTK